MNDNYKNKTDELIPIGKLAKILKISVSTLRYYDEIDLFKPAYVNPENGYRYYLPKQIYDIDFIISWRNFGFSINDIKKLISDINIDNMINLYEKKEQEIKNNIQKLKEVKNTILGYKSKLERLSNNVPNNSSDINIDIEHKTVPEMKVVFVSNKGHNYYGYRDSLNKLNRLIERHNIKVKDFTQIRSYYYEDPMSNVEARFDLIIPLTGNIELDYKFVKTMPEYKCVSCIHYGEYNVKLNEKIKYMKKWLMKNKINFRDELIIIHTIGTPITNDPKKFLTELQIPLSD